jgi:transglutaminase-like putative cysteine protease
MKGLMGRILRALSIREVLKFGLLAVFLTVVALEISPLIFRADTALFLSAVLFGLFLGWITGRIPLPPWAAGFLDGALGMDFLFLLIGRLDIPLRSWIGSSAVGLAHLLPQYEGEGFDLGAWLGDAYRILQGPVSVMVRFQGWAVSFFRGEVFFDPVASVLFWSLLLLLIGAFTGWTLSARGKPFAAVLPAFLLLAAVLASVQGDWHYAVLTVALVFGLVVTVEHNQKEQEWERKQMGYSTSLRWDLVFSVVPVLAVLLLGSYVIPSISLSDVTEWIREQSRGPAATGPGIGQSFGLNPAAGSASNASAAESIPRSHFLGRGPNLTKDVALVIVTREKLIYLPEVSEPVPPHHYWKYLTYDIYSGSGWLTSPTEEKELPAESDIHAVSPYGILLHQKVTVSRSGVGPVYAAGEVTKVYQLFRVVWRTDEDLLGAVVPGAVYEADSVYPDADEAALRAAGTEYPMWIRNRYLHLPEILPQRIHTLARDLTATLLTPYDRALAIQNYLRNEMHYSLTIDAPPHDRDVVDYFLFDSKEGFCDYYATAMVVLARSAGIPARMAMGYASGTFDPGKGTYTVLETDSHAWPELYFPGIGWVEFEPTSSMAEIQRSESPASRITGPILPRQTSAQVTAALNLVKSVFQQGALPALIVLLSVAVFFLGWTLLEPLRLWWISPSHLLRTVYRGLVAHGRRQGIRMSPSTTPSEFTRLLEQQHPGYEVSLERMADLYSRQVYGGVKITASQRKEVIGLWTRLNSRLWWAWWRSRLRLPRPRRGRPAPSRGTDG